MRRIATLFLLAVFSASFTEAGQLIKLPLLIEHYFDHQEQDEWSLADFLYKHYLDTHPDDGDEEEDRRLPFKTTNISTSLLAVAPASLCNPATYRPYPARTFCGYAKHFLVCVSLSGVFHPPKLA